MCYLTFKYSKYLISDSINVGKFFFNYHIYSNNNHKIKSALYMNMDQEIIDLYQPRDCTYFTNQEIAKTKRSHILYQPRDHRSLPTQRSHIFTNQEVIHTLPTKRSHILYQPRNHRSLPTQRSHLHYQSRDRTYYTNQEITHTLPTKKSQIFTKQEITHTLPTTRSHILYQPNRSHILYQPRDHTSLPTKRSHILYQPRDHRSLPTKSDNNTLCLSHFHTCNLTECKLIAIQSQKHSNLRRNRSLFTKFATPDAQQLPFKSYSRFFLAKSTWTDYSQLLQNHLRP